MSAAGARFPAKTLTCQEFLDGLEEDTRAEWVNGEVVLSSPASSRHQDLSDLLAFPMRF